MSKFAQQRREEGGDAAAVARGASVVHGSRNVRAPQQSGFMKAWE